MKWLITDVVETPAVGDYKFEKCFAWRPVKVQGYKVWLSYYTKVYEYTYRERLIFTGRKHLFFPCHGWDHIANQLISK